MILVLFDVSTLYFETGQGEGFREPGVSTERRLEPQTPLGLLTDSRGFHRRHHPVQESRHDANVVPMRAATQPISVRLELVALLRGL